MSEGTLYDKVWEEHTVSELPTGQTQLFCGLHLIHEVTSPQAFGMLQERDLEVAYPNRTHATVDHIVPTADQVAAVPRRRRRDDDGRTGAERPRRRHQLLGPHVGRAGYRPRHRAREGTHSARHDHRLRRQPHLDPRRVRRARVRYRDEPDSRRAGDPDRRDGEKKVRKIEVTGELDEGVEAKDVILEIIRRLGTEGGVGYVYEYAGEAIENLDMEGRMSICNMSIEGGARAGYVNPDETTYEWLEETDYFQETPSGSTNSSPTGSPSAPTRTPSTTTSSTSTRANWTLSSRGEPRPARASVSTTRFRRPRIWPTTRSTPPAAPRSTCASARRDDGGYDIDVAFLGSCTNARLPDLRRAARIVKGREVADDVRAFVVPGSQRVQRAAEEEGLTTSSRTPASSGATPAVRCVSA